MSELRLTIPRAIGEALQRKLEKDTTGYDEEGQAIGQFYDLLTAALELQPDGPATEGCKGCGKEKVVE